MSRQPVTRSSPRRWPRWTRPSPRHGGAGESRSARDTYLPKIRQARETIDFAYRRGGVNLLDYLDAQRTYREKSLEYLRSLANYRTAVYVLEAAVGGQLEN